MLKKIVIFLGIFFGVGQIFGTTVTSVIIYQPVVSQVVKKGECFANSIAAMRSNVWRCSVGNEIYDPCFETKEAGKLVCDADPSKNQNGFVLQLTKPLPKVEQSNPSAVSAWMIKLADGSICTPYTGTMPILPTANGIWALQYGCVDSHVSSKFIVGLLQDSIATGVSWQAKKVYAVNATGKLRIIKVISIAIDTVWQ